MLEQRSIITNARYLRKEATKAENILWQKLRNKNLGKGKGWGGIYLVYSVFTPLQQISFLFLLGFVRKLSRFL